MDPVEPINLAGHVIWLLHTCATSAWVACVESTIALSALSKIIRTSHYLFFTCLLLFRTVVFHGAFRKAAMYSSSPQQYLPPQPEGLVLSPPFCCISAGYCAQCQYSSCFMHLCRLLRTMPIRFYAFVPVIALKGNFCMHSCWLDAGYPSWMYMYTWLCTHVHAYYI